MFKRSAVAVQLGDKFVKTTDPHGKVWEVVHLWTAVDGILHARLATGERKTTLLTIAAAVLQDGRYWLPPRQM